MVDTGVAVGANMNGCYCYWLLEQLSPERDHLSVRAHWHKVSLSHFTPCLLVTGNVCGVFVLVACFLGCVFVVWMAFPGGIVDVFLNLASLDMTATVLSNAMIFDFEMLHLGQRHVGI